MRCRSLCMQRNSACMGTAESLQNYFRPALQPSCLLQTPRKWHL